MKLKFYTRLPGVIKVPALTAGSEKAEIPNRVPWPDGAGSYFQRAC